MEYQHKVHKKGNLFRISGFQLPYQTVTIVPCTQGLSTKISPKECSRRAIEVENKLIGIFGGYTKVEAHGGFYSDEEKRNVKEPVYTIEAFAQKKKFKENKKEWLKFVREKGKEWNQESMGVVLENDMVYVKTPKEKKKN